MKELLGWVCLFGAGIASYKQDRSLSMWLILLGYVFFVHADIDKIKKGMNL